jgi:hypothetical protein
MAAVIHYQIGDERSEAILDELERLRTARSKRLPGGGRSQRPCGSSRIGLRGGAGFHEAGYSVILRRTWHARLPRR